MRKPKNRKKMKASSRYRPNFCQHCHHCQKKNNLSSKNEDETQVYEGYPELQRLHQEHLEKLWEGREHILRMNQRSSITA